MILELERLTVRYGDFAALRAFSLRFEGGAMGLLGPNGAGKSTLIRTILGLVEPAEGSGRVLGLDIGREGRAIRQGVGYMPERDCTIPAMSGVRSIQYMAELSGLNAREARKRAHEAAQWVGLGDERYRPIESYSTGMKQRVKFAQAIVHAPRLLFLDEPTNGLDPAGHRQMLDLIREIAAERDIHVILATHLLPDVEATCDQVSVIEAGEMRRQGAIEALRRREERLFEVRVSGSDAAFRAKASSLDLQLQERGEGAFVLILPSERGTAALFQAAQAAGAVVTELRESRRSLQEVFLASLEGEKA